jgi:hypothetical protein
MQVIGFDADDAGELTHKASGVVQTMAQLRQQFITVGLAEQ